MTWYKSASLLSTVIAASALLLSQLPPITSWRSQETIQVKISNRIALNNVIGLIGFQILLDLKNSGNRQLNLSNITLEFEYPNSVRKVFKADSYVKILPGNPQPVNFPITSINLGIGQSWAEFVSFSPSFSPSDEEEINKIRLAISQSILERGQSAAMALFTPRSMIEASEGDVKNALRFFDDKFDLEKGKYKGTIRYDVNGTQRVAKSFEFTLYEYHLRMIRSQTDHYKYGAGIYFPGRGELQVSALISEAS